MTEKEIKCREYLKKELAFDQYGRYAIICNIIEENRKQGQYFKILDVGGKGNLLKKFLPEDKVFYLDIVVDPKDENGIQGDSCEMSFEAESYDWVVSADVFEHIDPKKREDFLNENIRVAKIGVVLAAPFYSEEVYKAEINVNENYKVLSGGQDHIWLREHIENGLPKEDELEDFLGKNNFKFQKIYNNILFLWQILLGIELIVEPYARNDSEIKEYFEDFNYFFNTEVFPFDWGKPAYRKIYFIKKAENLKELNIESKAITDELFLNVIKRGMNLISNLDAKNKKLISEDKNKLHTGAEQQKLALAKIKKFIEDKEVGTITLNQLIQKKDKKLEAQEKRILELSQHIQRKNEEIILKDQIIQDKNNEISFVVSSKFWKLRYYYLKIKFALFTPDKFIKKYFFKFKNIFKKGSDNLFSEGAKKTLIRTCNFLFYGKGKLNTNNSLAGGVADTLLQSDYKRWIENIEKSEKEINYRRSKDLINNLKYKPKISLLLPVYNTDEIFLRKTIFSVIYQYYTNWELCIVDDNSNKKIIKKILEEFKLYDGRVKVLYSDKNEGISISTNKAANIATGEFIALLDHDDEIESEALLENVLTLNKDRSLDFIYSDDDKMDENGNRYDPQFKPDWSPELLLSYCYVSHLKVIRLSLFLELGGFKKEFDGSQDYEFLLRMAEKTEKIGHIQKILYHWRSLRGSVARSASEKPLSIERGRMAVEETLVRRNIKASVIIPEFAIKNNVGIFKLKFNPADYDEKVTIIIPTKDNVGLLKKCISSIKSKTTYKNYEIVVVNNNSKKKKTFDYFKKENIRYIDIKTDKFNFSKINNLVVEKIKTKLIVFMNNDVEVINPDWLLEMVGSINLNKKISAVGPKLIYQDNRVQHGGILLGLHDMSAGHANKLLDKDDAGYLAYNLVTRNYSAVTAACMLTKSDLFKEFGGFDEKNLAVAYNDVDYCLKLLIAGYRIVYNPNALLFHHEGASRGFADNQDELEYFKNKWKNLIFKDPHYNVNLSLENEQFRIKNK